MTRRKAVKNKRPTVDPTPSPSRRPTAFPSTDPTPSPMESVLFWEFGGDWNEDSATVDSTLSPSIPAAFPSTARFPSPSPSSDPTIQRQKRRGFTLDSAFTETRKVNFRICFLSEAPKIYLNPELLERHRSFSQFLQNYFGSCDDLKVFLKASQSSKP